MTFVFMFTVLLVDGVFADTDERKSVVEGNPVTLHTDGTEIQKADLITWTFGTDNTRIAQINRSIKKYSIYQDVLDGRFRDRLKVDHQTGSLTITNISTEHTGRYEIQTFGGNQAPSKTFNIIVYARLPIPIIRNSSQCSSSDQNCSVLCSVVNVSHVTLSWYKGNSSLSSISVSDLSISLSLPLEVEYQDTNTYSCVLHNPISHQTQHVDISGLCRPCSGLSIGYIVLFFVCAPALSLAVILFGFYWYCRLRRSKQSQQDEVETSSFEKYSQCQTDGVQMNTFERFPQSQIYEVKTSSLGRYSHIYQPYEVRTASLGRYSMRSQTNGVGTSSVGKSSQRSVTVDKDEMRIVLAMEGNSVTLNTEIGEILEDDLIEWRFADCRENNQTEFLIIAEWNKIDGVIYQCNEEIFKDRLEIDDDSGSLTIRNATLENSGFYKLHITSEEQNISMILFSVVVHVPN